MDANEKEAGVAVPREAPKEEAGKKKRAASFIKNIFFGTLYALCGYLLSGIALPYGATPFGVALLAAADRYVPYIYGGLILSALGSDRQLLLIGVYTALLLVRLLVRLVLDTPWRRKDAESAGERTLGEVYPVLFSEHISLRAATAAVGAFALGLYRLIEGGMLYYDMYGTIVGTLAAPAAVLLAGGFFSARARRYRRTLGFIALAFGVVYAFGDARSYGISLAALSCMLATLYLSRTEGTVTGALSGALLGIAVSVELTPSFAFAGLVSGMLLPVSPMLSLLSALSVSTAWAVYAEGLSVLGGTLSGLVTATLVFGIWDKLFLSQKKKAVSVSAEKKEERAFDTRREYLRSSVSYVTERERLSELRRRIVGLSEGLSSVSELLVELSRRLQSPCYADLRQICDSAFECSCAGCPQRPVCWGDNYRQTSDAIGALCVSLQKKGSVEIGEVDGALYERCERLPDVISQINHNVYLHARQLFENDRTELFASDFAAASGLLGRAVSGGEDEYAPDAELWRQIDGALSERGVDVRGGCVFGKRRRTVIIFGAERDGLCDRAEEIRVALESVLKLPVRREVRADVPDELVFVTGERLSVTFAERQLLAEGETEYCGDTAGVFEGSNGSRYAFISDGMGSGREAALTSGLCGLFLRRLLGAGADTEGALGLLNGFLRNRGGGSLHECSATVDLMELDLYLCRARFYKSGAAPTYVYRNGSLFKLRSHTVPVGIIKELDFRKIDLELSAGDLVVMVSDGVTDGHEECPWLFDLLRTQSESEPERIAELVVKYARAEGAVDDISVIVVKVREEN